jgi:hypothetical protein
MPCIVVLLALIGPRVALIGMAIFSDVLKRAFDGVLLPLIGFFILPWTTLTYAFVWNTGTHEVRGVEWFFVVLAFLADLASYGGGVRGRG